MTAPAAFQATVHSLRTVAGRKVVQLVVEAPIEHLPTIARIAEHGSWVAVARLVTGEDVSDARNAATDTAASDRNSVPARRTFADMAPSQQAGMLCDDESFRKFLVERHSNDWAAACRSPTKEIGCSADIAAECVYRLCNVTSRADLTTDNTEWHSLVLAYRLWMRAVEPVEA